MKNQQLTSFGEFKNKFMNTSDKVKVFKFFYNYNNCFDNITQEDMEDCRQAENIEKFRACKVFIGVGSLMLAFDKTILRHRKISPLTQMLSYALLPSFSFQITKKYFCKDVEQIFHDMADKYQFSFKQYHEAMDLIARAQKANKLDEFREQGLKFDWGTIKED